MKTQLSLLLLFSIILLGKAAQAEQPDASAFLSEYKLTAAQNQRAREILREAEPRITELYIAINATRKQLHSLSIDSSSKTDELEHLGERLLHLRNTLRAELNILNMKLEKEVGINPELGHQRGCARLLMPRLREAEEEVDTESNDTCSRPIL